MNEMLPNNFGLAESKIIRLWLLFLHVDDSALLLLSASSWVSKQTSKCPSNLHETQSLKLHQSRNFSAKRIFQQKAMQNRNRLPSSPRTGEGKDGIAWERCGGVWILN